MMKPVDNDTAYTALPVEMGGGDVTKNKTTTKRRGPPGRSSGWSMMNKVLLGAGIAAMLVVAVGVMTGGASCESLRGAFWSDDEDESNAIGSGSQSFSWQGEGGNYEEDKDGGLMMGHHHHPHKGPHHKHHNGGGGPHHHHWWHDGSSSSSSKDFPRPHHHPHGKPDGKKHHHSWWNPGSSSSDSSSSSDGKKHDHTWWHSGSSSSDSSSSSASSSSSSSDEGPPPPPPGKDDRPPPPPPPGKHDGPPPPPKGKHDGPPPPPKGKHDGPPPPPKGPHYGPPKGGSHPPKHDFKYDGEDKSYSSSDDELFWEDGEDVFEEELVLAKLDQMAPKKEILWEREPMEEEEP